MLFIFVAGVSNSYTKRTIFTTASDCEFVVGVQYSIAKNRSTTIFRHFNIVTIKPK